MRPPGADRRAWRAPTLGPGSAGARRRSRRAAGAPRSSGSAKGGHPGRPNGVEADGVGGSCRIADASAMRLDVEPDFLHADVADASPASRVHRRCIGDASAIRRDPPTPSTSTPFGRPPTQRTEHLVSPVFPPALRSQRPPPVRAHERASTSACAQVSVRG